jgi:hypothetical protein
MAAFLMRRAGWLRAAAAVQAVLGAALLAQPVRIGQLVTARRGQDPAAWLVRILGLRMLAQGTVELVRPGRKLVLAGAAVDLLHALSMVGVGLLWPRFRRAALASAGAATATAAAGAATAAALP